MFAGRGEPRGVVSVKVVDEGKGGGGIGELLETGRLRWSLVVERQRRQDRSQGDGVPSFPKVG